MIGSRERDKSLASSNGRLCLVAMSIAARDSQSLQKSVNSRAFMQDTMNKMVSSVRHGVLGPDQASRTIHECAAMLGLELAAPIPENSIIVSGMRKTVTRTDMIVAFREFGDIEDAAVSSNSRGFGKEGLLRVVCFALKKKLLMWPYACFVCTRVGSVCLDKVGTSSDEQVSGARNCCSRRGCYGTSSQIGREWILSGS